MTHSFGNIPQSFQLGIETLLTGDVKLASPPEIYLKINEILDDPAKTPRDAEQVIQYDPGLSARLLRLVNSAFYGFPRQITSISRAITILGIRELRDLVLATVVMERFGHLPNTLMTLREFWRLSVRLALLAKVMKKHVAQSGRMESVFLCGLLHEIGRLVIYARIPELARAAMLLSEQKSVEETDAERAVYGFDHYQLAAELARRWNLPPVIVTTLYCHGHPEDAESFDLETALVSLACRLSLDEVRTPQQLEAVLPGLRKFMEPLRLDSGRLPRIVAEADENFETVFRAFFQG